MQMAVAACCYQTVALLAFYAVFSVSCCARGQQYRAGEPTAQGPEPSAKRAELTPGVEATGAPLACPFRATRIAINRQGTRLLACARRGQATRLALIDPGSNSVLAERELEGAVIAQRMAAAVCLISSCGDEQTLHSLDPNTLEDLAQKKVTVSTYRQHRGERLLRLVGDDRLILDRWFHLPDLADITPAGRDTVGDRIGPAMRTGGGNMVDGRVVNGWCIDGAIWDEAFQQPQLLLSLPDFIHHQQATSHWDNAWVRRPGSVSGSFSSKRILTGQTAVDLPSLESNDVAARLGIALHFDETRGLARADLVARDLQNKKTVQRWPINLMRPETGRSYSYWLSVNGSAVGIALDGRVYGMDICQLRSLDYPRPLRFVPVQSMLLAARDGPTQLVYQVSGGEPPYELKATIPGMKDPALMRPISNRKLAVSFHCDGYIAEQRKKIARTLLDWSPATEPSEAVMERYCESVSPYFRRLFGRNPEGVPLVVPIQLEVSDGGGQSARLHHLLLAEVHAERLVSALDEEIVIHWKGTTVASEASKRLENRRLIELWNDVITFLRR